MSKAAPPDLEEDEYRLHVCGGVGSLAEALGALPENGWELVSVDLRDDVQCTHTIRVRPVRDELRQPPPPHPQTSERGP